MANENLSREGNRKTVIAGVKDSSGDIFMLRVDESTGRLLVDASITAFTGVTDGEAVDGDDTGTLILGTDGSNYQVLAVDSSGNLQVDIVSGAGGTEYTEDEATANPIVGKAVMVERDDALTTVTPIEGDNIGLRGTAEGALWTQDFNSDAILADTAAIDTATAAIQAAVEGTLTVGSHAVTNAGTFAVQISDTSFAVADGNTLGEGVLIQGDDGTDRKNINVDATTGDVQVDITNEPSVALSAVDNAVLDTIDAVLDTINAKLVTGTDIGDVTINNSTGGSAVNIQDGGNTITVDGTVTANLSAVDNAVLDTIDTVLDTINAKLVTGTDIGDVTINNSTGASAVNIQDGGNTITVDGTVTATPSGVQEIEGDEAEGSASLPQPILIGGDDGTDVKNINVDATTGDVQVDVTNTVTVGSHAVTNAGTFATQVTGNALTALQLIDDVVYVDDADWTADSSKHTLVGGVTQATPSANTDGDTTPLITNALRELRVATPESDLAAASTTHVHKYYTSATPTDGIIWSPASGKRWYVTHLSINVSAASTVTIEDDKTGGDDPVYKAEFAANSGVVLTFPGVPLFSGEDAADLTVTASAGTVYVTAVGYEI